ncbi:ribonuclease H-like [Gigantopelta aegis]|uniref:ribonuclease H-like n=1 Tax=Gigantopelta aegis TaxID=1735272 RepID=UPI001B88D95E|nr:ribonuclease H-like [Gigantopelta aegis]
MHTDVLMQNACQYEELSPNVWSPTHHLPEIKLDDPGLTTKREQSPSQQLALPLEMIDRLYPKTTWIHAFTDGSAENAIRKGGSGEYIGNPDGSSASLSIPVGELSSNYRAELQALIAATELLIEKGKKQNTVLLTDSLSALQSLSSGPSELLIRQLQETFNALNQSCKVILQWIPAHVGVAGKEKADQLAKAGSCLPQLNSSISYSEASQS